MISATRPSRQSSTNRPTTAATSVSEFVTSVVSPCERTSETASTSDVSRALIREVAQRQRGQVTEEVLAQREHDALPHLRETADHRRRQHPRSRVDAEVDDDVAPEAAGVAGLHAVVDRVLHEQQPDHRTGGAEDRDHGEEGDAPELPAQVAAEARETGARLTRQGLRLRTAGRTSPRG